MDIRFDGKRALVTGAGKGIGRDIAIALHKGGAETVAVSRTQADLDSLQAQYPDMKTLTQDLSDWAATRSAIEALGHFDLLVNNAAVHRMIPFLDFPEDQIDLVFNSNYKSVFNVSQVVARGMVERGVGGAIVNISSDSAPSAFQGEAAYGASKAAVDALTRIMALELGPKQIRVNSVLPSLTRTAAVADTYLKDQALLHSILSRVPLGRIAEVEDITNVVLFLLSDKAAFVNGVALLVDGGLTARG